MERQPTERSADAGTTDHAVYTCTSCDSIALGTRTFLATSSCCGGPLREVTRTGIETTTPTAEAVTHDVFGLPKNGLEICRYTADAGAVTVADVAAEFGNERSVVSRYLNRLADAGFLEKTDRIRRGGGVVNVYYPAPDAETGRHALASLYLWSATAMQVLEGTGRARALPETGGESTNAKLAAVYWE